MPYSTPYSHRFCVAPMMDWSTRACRYFHRQLSRQALLYTEMVTTGALLHGDVARHLDYDAAEHPLALQLGGSAAGELAHCAELAERWGYAEVNLNCGCPSDRVQEGRFGACLMREPAHVAASVAAMRGATALPVTVKCRIGVDDCEDESFLRAFVDRVAAAGCETFIVHARKAWLSGLSPKENREVPPLDYDMVYRLKQDYPQLRIVINGGIETLDDCEEHLRHVDGVMLGRAAYHRPWLMSEVDERLFGAQASTRDRHQIVHALFPYVEQRLAAGNNLPTITRHILGLFHGQPGGRKWRRVLSERACRPGAGIDVIEDALAAVSAASEFRKVA